jgi:hypothetical protein
MINKVKGAPRTRNITLPLEVLNVIKSELRTACRRQRGVIARRKKDKRKLEEIFKDDEPLKKIALRNSKSPKPHGLGTTRVIPSQDTPVKKGTKKARKEGPKEKIFNELEIMYDKNPEELLLEQLRGATTTKYCILHYYFAFTTMYYILRFYFAFTSKYCTLRFYFVFTSKNSTLRFYFTFTTNYFLMPFLLLNHFNKYITT